MTYADYVAAVEAALDKAVPQTALTYADGQVPARLAEAMRYSLLAGGKRLRPVLLLAAVDALGGDRDEAMPLACALEMIHTYSLIHDDLPGMDNDDLRRGRPTNHKVFGEGMAILAGDALLNGAHEWMLQNALSHPAHLDRHLRAITEISRRAGTTGMIAGQTLDMLSEGQGGDADTLRYIHMHKTADLLTAPVTAAAMLCGAPDAIVAALEVFGQNLGLAFQIADDLLDVTGDAAQMGKATGMDVARGKLTWPSLLGLDAARAEADRLTADAHRALAPLGDRALALHDIADGLTARKT